ncbi:universal stress protein [Camelliibacillus cellulosilyticus]|uniref:Universal stress protein n=1 Tax=Camelliibacillus cellulosilyticus TaxID=2174486 RepID=A0ABV9GM06_9BACL
MKRQSKHDRQFDFSEDRMVGEGLAGGQVQNQYDHPAVDMDRPLKKETKPRKANDEQNIQAKGDSPMAIASNILVAYDGSELSEKALQTALTMAEQNHGVKVSIVNVIDYTTTVGVSMSYSNQLPDLAENAEDLMAKVKDRLADTRVDAKVEILNGHAAATLVKFAAENDCDLIIMGSRGLSGIQKLFLGSVSQEVVQNAPCQVLIIK